MTMTKTARFLLIIYAIMFGITARQKVEVKGNEVEQYTAEIQNLIVSIRIPVIIITVILLVGWYF